MTESYTEARERIGNDPDELFAEPEQLPAIPWELARTADGYPALFRKGEVGDCIAKFMKKTAWEQPLPAEQNARATLGMMTTLRNIVIQFEKTGAVSAGMIEQAKFDLAKLGGRA